MSFVLLDVVSSLSRFAGALFCDAFIFPLLLLPSAVSLVCFVLRLAFVRLRKFSVRWVFYLSAVSLLFYAAVASLSGKAVGVLAFIGFFAAACDLVCVSLLFLPFPRRKRKACKKKKAEEHDVTTHHKRQQTGTISTQAMPTEASVQSRTTWHKKAYLRIHTG